MNKDKDLNSTTMSKRNTGLIITFGLIFFLIFLIAGYFLYFRFEQKVYGELLFTKSLDGHGSVHSINSDGSGLTKITNPSVNVSLKDLQLSWHRFKILNYERLPPLYNISSAQDAQWSPDGTHIAYRSHVNGMANIYLLNVNHQNKQQLTHNIDVYHFEWLNQNEILLQSSNHQVYLLDTKTSHSSAIPCLNGFLDVSPDGSQIVTVDNPSNELSDDFTQLVIADLDCSDKTIIVEQTIDICDASWSPKGDEILFVNYGTTVEGHTCNQIYRISTDGTNQFRVDNNDFSSKYQATWSPDGEKIAYAANENEAQDIYIIDRNGNDLIRLTNSPIYDQYPVWSPNGDKLAFGFVDYNRNQSGIYIYNVAHSKLKPIAINQYSGGQISWRP